MFKISYYSPKCITELTQSEIDGIDWTEIDPPTMDSIPEDYLHHVKNLPILFEKRTQGTVSDACLRKLLLKSMKGRSTYYKDSICESICEWAGPEFSARNVTMFARFMRTGPMWRTKLYLMKYNIISLNVYRSTTSLSTVNMEEVMRSVHVPVQEKFEYLLHSNFIFDKYNIIDETNLYLHNKYLIDLGLPPIVVNPNSMNEYEVQEWSNLGCLQWDDLLDAFLRGEIAQEYLDDIHMMFFDENSMNDRTFYFRDNE